MNMSGGSFLIGALFGMVVGAFVASKTSPESELQALRLEHARLEVQISQKVHQALQDTTGQHIITLEVKP